MMFPIHFPDKKSYDLFKQILQEIKQHSKVPYWRFLLTITSENLNRLNNNELYKYRVEALKKIKKDKK
jgi:hypothetical protein